MQSKRQQDVKPQTLATPKSTVGGPTQRTNETVDPKNKSVLERLKAYVDLKFPAVINELPHLSSSEKNEAEQEQLQEMMTFFLD